MPSQMLSTLASIMKDRSLKIIFGIVSALLLISLFIKLKTVPGGLILSGIFLGGMFIVAILIACLLIAFLLRLFIKKYSFLTLYLILTSISFITYHYQLYSPILKVIVPDGYVGEVNLVQSNVDENILTLDSNGIGYLNKWTFNKLYSRPEVYTTSGKNINNLCVGFNPSAFFGVSKFCCVDGKVIRSKSFDITPDSINQVKPFYSKGFSQFVDTQKLYDRK
jgi:hypothetical protein